MGLKEFFLGEEPKAKTSKEWLITGKQKELLKELSTNLGSGYLTEGPVSPDVGASLGAMEEWAKNVYAQPPGEQTRPNLTSDTGRAGTDAIQDVIGRGPQNFDNYFKDAVEKPLFETFREDIAPGIQRKYAPSGFYSSERLESERRAEEDLIDALTQGRASMAYQTYSDDLNRKLTGGQALKSLDLQENIGAEELLNQGKSLGQADRQLAAEQLYRNFGLQRDIYTENQRRKEHEANLMLAALGVRPFENITTVSGGSTGLLPGLLQAGGTAVGAIYGGPGGGAAGGAAGKAVGDQFSKGGQDLSLMKRSTSDSVNNRF